ncbi:hypothetical protein EG349_08440 [Chryseobacterium shandongense]|jgi:plasmid stabilization system protein ParE|uniref:Type II toxin-antitoxin system RelE/ParE family toxin n=1 Tax=Chryseobacterium shandongense TaxID=1493872 RepID=A0A3G6Q2E6_9FLAO|nr:MULTISPECIES: hypothetical protein [Chryseobacterium]AZA58580.1 hypothetical protein EG350_15930 [Chryseobacterium shandongense]AZA86814.1 hypothetical protein EG349_08440 [Chryseobacterium shandongense]AZA95228.1 hypothetical protein EG353_06460 [Chryseobacterium shandongense]
MKILLSSIAKNDIRLLMRVFGAENKQKGIDFIESLKTSINSIAEQPGKPEKISICSMRDFPVTIHYVFENEETLFVTAIFRK